MTIKSPAHPEEPRRGVSKETQHAHFVEAVQLLGGERSAAHVLRVSDRTVRRLIAGDSPIHDGFLRDMAAALLAHADACRALEKQINPLFSANLVNGQAREDGRRTARKQEI